MSLLKTVIVYLFRLRLLLLSVSLFYPSTILVLPPLRLCIAFAHLSPAMVCVPRTTISKFKVLLQYALKT